MKAFTECFYLLFYTFTLKLIQGSFDCEILCLVFVDIYFICFDASVSVKKILEYLVDFLEAQNDLFKDLFVYFMLNSQEFMVKGLSPKKYERSEGSKAEM